MATFDFRTIKRNLLSSLPAQSVQGEGRSRFKEAIFALASVDDYCGVPNKLSKLKAEASRWKLELVICGDILCVRYTEFEVEWGLILPEDDDQLVGRIDDTAELNWTSRGFWWSDFADGARSDRFFRNKLDAIKNYQNFRTRSGKRAA